mmetsp:Transcript_26016/g.74972  ORF Transcript_26016/g.74972 Transcript_26016/m.74972 type:complete len:178 (-) Transcript_26016:221-754(-)
MAGRRDDSCAALRRATRSPSAAAAEGRRRSGGAGAKEGGPSPPWGCFLETVRTAAPEQLQQQRQPSKRGVAPPLQRCGHVQFRGADSLVSLHLINQERPADAHMSRLNFSLALSDIQTIHPKYLKPKGLPLPTGMARAGGAPLPRSTAAIRESGALGAARVRGRSTGPPWGTDTNLR